VQLVGRSAVAFGAISLCAGVTLSAPPTPEPAPPARPCDRLFGIVHKVTLDQDGRISRIDVEGISAPSENVMSPSEAARIGLNLPSSYLTAARRFLESRSYRGTQSPFWTFTIYDPAQPDNANPCR
jgi:hypothetical protein